MRRGRIGWAVGVILIGVILLGIWSSNFGHRAIFYANENGDGITGVATILLTFVTAGLVWLGYLQLVTTRTQLRAYVFATGFEQLLEKDAASGHYFWRFRPTWINTGDTPTKDLIIHCECDVRNSLLPNGFNFNYPTTNTGSGLIIPKGTNAGGVAPAYPKAAITAQDIADSQTGKKFIYLYGWARYKDVFPRTKTHVSRFCWLVYTLGDPMTFVPDDPNHTLRFTYLNHTEGNSADDE